MRHYPYTQNIQVGAERLELLTAIDWIDSEMNSIQVTTERGGYQFYILAKEKVRIQILLAIKRTRND